MGQPQRRPGDGCRRRCAGVFLGGAAIYHGELHQRPLLGSGPQPQGRDIYRALALVRQGVLLWLLVLAGLWAMGWLHA